MQAFGANTPAPCEWGEVTGTVFSDGAASTTGLAFRAFYDFGFKETILQAKVKRRRARRRQLQPVQGRQPPRRTISRARFFYRAPLRFRWCPPLGGPQVRLKPDATCRAEAGHDARTANVTARHRMTPESAACLPLVSDEPDAGCSADHMRRLDLTADQRALIGRFRGARARSLRARAPRTTTGRRRFRRPTSTICSARAERADRADPVRRPWPRPASRRRVHAVDDHRGDRQGGSVDGAMLGGPRQLAAAARRDGDRGAEGALVRGRRRSRRQVGGVERRAAGARARRVAELWHVGHARRRRLRRRRHQSLCDQRDRGAVGDPCSSVSTARAASATHAAGPTRSCCSAATCPIRA